MQGVPVAGSVAQHEWCGSCLAGGVAFVEPLLELVGPGGGAAKPLGPVAGDGQEVRPEGCPQVSDEVRERWGEVAVLALAEAVAGHVDGRPEQLVVVVEPGDGSALVGAEDGTRDGATEVVEIGGNVGPREPVDPSGDRRRDRRCVGHAAASRARSARLASVATEVVAEGPVAADDTMAGHDDGERVVGAGASDGPHRLGVPCRGGDGRVAPGGSVGDGAEVLEDVAAEAPGQAEIDGDVDGAAVAGEVLLELAGGILESARGAQDARADLGGELGEDGVMVFPVEGDPGEAAVRAGQQERTEWAVDDAVGDVEQAVAFCGVAEPVVQPGRRSRIGVVERRAKRVEEGWTGVAGGGHVKLPFRRRSLAMPSAALRRAAGSLQSRRAATSA